VSYKREIYAELVRAFGHLGARWGRAGRRTSPLPPLLGERACAAEPG
jgi:hypothetical protein